MGYLYTCRKAKIYKYPLPLPIGTYTYSLLPSAIISVTSASESSPLTATPLTAYNIQLQTLRN